MILKQNVSIIITMSILNTFNVVRFEKKLRNGIKVVLFYRPGSPITTHAVLNSGSRFDPVGMFGVAHFLEHLVVGGSAEFPTKDLLAEHIESIGGSFGARTGQDSLIIATEVPDKSDYGRVVDIFKATLCEPLIDKKFFENEKKVVVKEVNRSNSNPAQVLIKTCRDLFFKGTSFSHEVLGDAESIQELDYEKVVAIHKRMFDKTRITFIVSGDISIEELVLNLEKLNFLEGNDFFEKSYEPKVIYEKRISSSPLDIPQTYICFGIPAPKLFSKELVHLNLAGDILAGGRSSRLTKRLRYDKGLVYGVRYGRVGGLELGFWGFFTDTASENVNDLMSEISEEIKNIRTNGIKASELEFVKNKNIKSLKRTMQTSNSWVDFHNLSEAFSSEPYDIDNFAKYIEEATVEDIENIINKYFQTNNWRLATCGKTEEESVIYKI